MLARYRDLALGAFNVLVAFVVANGMLAVAWAIHDRPDRIEKFDLYGAERVMRAYPGWSQDDVAELLREDQTLNQYEPYTEFKPKPKSGRFVNVSPQGFRLLDAQQSWPPDASAPSVFVFGGSTTYGAGLPDGQTIPAHLRERLAERGCSALGVYNFGRPHYTSTQERVLFERLAAAGSRPTLAIFVDGLNDFYHWKGVPNWTDAIGALVEHANDRGGALVAAADFVRRTSFGRTAAFLARLLGRGSGPGGMEADVSGPPFDDPATARAVIERWRENLRIVGAVGNAYGIRTLFVWQPVPTYRYDLRQHLLYSGDMAYFRGHQRSRFGYALMEQLRPSLGLGEEVLWLDGIQDGRAENLYVDGVHYTSAFADEIARAIADRVVELRALDCAR